MRIAIDARELLGTPTGVGRYLGEILSAWNDLPQTARHQFVLCAPSADGLARWDQLHLSVLTAAGQGTLWEQLTLPRLAREARADVLFAPAYTGPLRSPAPMVLTIHDVSFAAHPEWFGWKEGLRRRVLTRRAAHRAARILTVSDFSKREIVRHLDIAAGKVDVIYSGFAERLVRPHEPRTAATVIYVGSLFNRRRIPELIDGFARLALRRPEVRLEIVGDNRTQPRIDMARLVNATAIGDRIRLRSYISDEELALLYGSARAFVFLSEYEGFGLTPLEALAAGIPIVVLDTPVAREIYGAAAIYVPRPDPALIESALERALFDEEERARLLEAAETVLPRYSWPTCATRVLDILLACGAAT